MGPEVTEEIVLITFLADKIAEEMYESLTLQLVPTPATVQTMPMGEGVFFKQEIPLIITDIDCKFNNRLVNVQNLCSMHINFRNTDMISYYDTMKFSMDSFNAQCADLTDISTIDTLTFSTAENEK